MGDAAAVVGVAPEVRAAGRSAAVEAGAVFACAFVGVAGLAAASGGYFPNDWGWASLAFAWLAGAAALLRAPMRLGRSALLFVGCLTALACWSLASLAWAPSGAPLFGAERTLVYVTGVAAALIGVRPRTVPQLLGGVLGGLVAIDAYALATRLLPDRVGSQDVLAANRLAVPVGYWTGLGLASVIALLLAVAFAIRGRSIATRALAAAALPTLLLALYFTFSRGSWLVLIAGVLVMLAVDSRRLELVTGTAIVSVPAAVALWLAWRSPSLGRQGGTVAATVHDGHRLAVLVCLLTLASAAIAGVVAVFEHRVTLSAMGARLYAGALAALALAALVLGLVHVGGPAGAAHRAWRSFTAPPIQVTNGQQEKTRLFSLSNNGRIGLWRAAWHDAQAHPLLGGGAGSYEAWWKAHRTIPQQVRDSHSLYLQTLAELGPIGLALLLAALALPIGVGVRRRHHPLVPFALAAYVAYLIHAGADWDWQLTGVTLPALLVGAALVVVDRAEDGRPVRELVRVAAAAAAGLAVAVSFFMLLGNVPLRKATAAADAGRWHESAVEARKATRWTPWSSEPWRVLGEAELASRNLPAARSALQTALAKDPQNWQIWFDLSAAEHGRGAARALATASRLNPLSPEIAQARSLRG